MPLFPFYIYLDLVFAGSFVEYKYEKNNNFYCYRELQN